MLPVPTRKKVRPSSATGRLQSHPSYSTSLFDDNRSVGARHEDSQPLRRPKTTSGGPRYWVGKVTTESQEEKNRPRRISLTTVEEYPKDETGSRNTSLKPLFARLGKGKVCYCVRLNSEF